jgi:outer membrane receptor for ferrienterochelin and colicins
VREVRRPGYLPKNIISLRREEEVKMKKNEKVGSWRKRFEGRSNDEIRNQPRIRLSVLRGKNDEQMTKRPMFKLGNLGIGKFFRISGFKNWGIVSSVAICILALLVTGCWLLVTPAYAAEDRQEKVFDLGEVVITPTRTPKLLGDVALHTTIITKEEITKSGARNIGEVIEKETGVKVDSYGAMGAQTKVSMRGSSSKQVLVLIDGQRMNCIRAGDVDFSEFPLLEHVERIEIVRGPGSALYGSSAMGGVINIITKEPPKKPTFSYETSYATHNTFINKFTHGAKIKKFGYLLSGGHYQTQGHRLNSDYHAYDLFGKLTYDLTDWSKLLLEGGYYNGEVGMPGPKAGWGANDPDNRLHTHRVWGNLGWKAKLGERANLSLKGYGKEEKLKEITHTAAPTTHKMDTLGGEAEYSIEIGKRNKVTLGTDLHEDRLDSTSSGTHALTTQAYWIQDEIKICEPLIFTVGSRWDYHPSFGTEGSPKASILYKVTKKTTLRVSGGKAFRAPTLDDLYANIPGMGVGNPDLKPEKAWAYEGGIDQVFTKNLLGKLTFFRREVDNLIAWKDEDGDGTYNPENVDKALIWGSELELKAKMGKYFSSGIGYTWLETRNKSRGNNFNNHLTYQPMHKANAYLEYKTKFGLLARAEEEFVDSRFVNAANTKARELPPYFLTNLRVEYTTPSLRAGTKLTWFAECKNLFNTYYEMRENYPMSRRTGTVGMKIKF